MTAGRGAEARGTTPDRAGHPAAAADGVPDGDGLKLAQDYSFDSPSTASGVLLGRTSNGRVDWKDNEGRTLKEIQTAAVEEPGG